MKIRKDSKVSCEKIQNSSKRDSELERFGEA